MVRGGNAFAALSLYAMCHQLLLIVHQRAIDGDVEAHDHEIFVIDDMFNESEVRLVHKTLDARKPDFVRKELPMRSAGALSLRELRYTPVAKLFRDHATLERIQCETGMSLQLVPRSDKNQVNALLYSHIGDGVDSHRDGNVYVGTRWAGIYVVRDDYNSPLIVDGAHMELRPNSFLLFRADLLRHGVLRRTVPGERLVINVLLCDICTPKVDLASLLYQHIINELVFY